MMHIHTIMGLAILHTILLHTIIVARHHTITIAAIDDLEM
jgi:hypothetical protein